MITKSIIKPPIISNRRERTLPIAIAVTFIKIIRMLLVNTYIASHIIGQFYTITAQRYINKSIFPSFFN